MMMMRVRNLPGVGKAREMGMRTNMNMEMIVDMDMGMGRERGKRGKEVRMLMRGSRVIKRRGRGRVGYEG